MTATSPPVSEGKSTFGFRTMLPLVASAVLNPLNSTLIAVALVPIGQSFGAGPARTAWLISALYLATAVGQPIVGLFVDRFGARKVLLAGAMTVAVAGLAGMFALSLEWLIGVRAVLGIGTCAGFPAAMAVLRQRADATGHGAPSGVLAVLAMSAQTIMVVGPTLGGALIGVFGWPAIFAVNVPLAGSALLFALRWVPKDTAPTNAVEPEPIDLVGIMLFSVTLLTLLLYVMEPGLGDLYLLAAALVLGAAFVLVELRVSRPFLDLRMLIRNRAMLCTYLRQALAFLIIYSVLFGYVQWLEYGRGFSESAAGILLLPMSGVALGGAALSGRGTGVRLRLIITAVALLTGSGSLLLVDSHSALPLLLAIGAVFGVGQGLTSVTNQTTLYSQAPAEHMGTASGLFRTAQYLGAIAASTLIALCYGAHASSAGLHALAWTLVGVSVVLLLVTLADRDLRSATLAKNAENAHDEGHDRERAETRHR